MLSDYNRPSKTKLKSARTSTQNSEVPVENLEIRVIKNSKFGPFSGP